MTILMAQEHIKSGFPFSPCKLTSYLILKNTNPNAKKKGALKSGTNKLHCKKILILKCLSLPGH